MSNRLRKKVTNYLEANFSQFFANVLFPLEVPEFFVELQVELKRA